MISSAPKPNAAPRGSGATFIKASATPWTAIASRTAANPRRTASLTTQRNSASATSRIVSNSRAVKPHNVDGSLPPLT